MNPKKSPARVRAPVAAVAAGHTLRRAAALAGVHVATACRWQAADPALRRRLVAAGRAARPAEFAARPRGRPWVPVHPACPRCGGPADPFRPPGCFAFWRCRSWPRCPWSSWRPRHPRDCPGCGGPRFWSHSRRSVWCGRCRTRITTH